MGLVYRACMSQWLVRCRVRILQDTVRILQAPCRSCLNCQMMLRAGDHLYRMNYQDFVLKHRKTGADITVAALPCGEKNATAFGLMKIDGSGRIVDFAEKPKGDALRAMQVDTTILGLDAERYAWLLHPHTHTLPG